MICANIDTRIREFYEYAARNGFSEELFLQEDNRERYVAAALDGYRDYPLFVYVFGGKYDEKAFSKMMSIDFKSRLCTTAGIATDGYESVMLIEPPMARKTGMLQYVKVATPRFYSLLFDPAMYRQEAFERYAQKMRKGFLDDRTWYMYIFATKKKFQHRGYGKKLMNVMLSYADLKGFRICLETNHLDNITLYEHFGFELMSLTVYKDELEHCVMLYNSH